MKHFLENINNNLGYPDDYCIQPKLKTLHFSSLINLKDLVFNVIASKSTLISKD